MYLFATQPIGRQSGVEGSDYVSTYCDEDGEPYTLSLFAYRGRFALAPSGR